MQAPQLQQHPFICGTPLIWLQLRGGPPAHVLHSRPHVAPQQVIGAAGRVVRLGQRQAVRVLRVGAGSKDGGCVARQLEVKVLRTMHEARPRQPPGCRSSGQTLSTSRSDCGCLHPLPSCALGVDGAALLASQYL